ncbi:serine/threonine protein phosphatase PrpC [Variovorax boronicumulans]|uniref:PP2C family protein-serine/threonine phosphatase n=1 Tax=Variovorax boronicumulans TaxID=436515 RepID=UPI002784C3D7|nr:protein phosphatase 2C domain-containing protein [Variovorax boronicumulans]MDP9908341.1 serine/threonine protein phosphatase PrpC [Variovorax boronicumulans]
MTQGFRLAAATGLHKGDRPYQQDQVLLMSHPRTPGCVLGVIADGMGGRSGGRKASDQVLMTARQLFTRYSPERDDPAVVLRQLLEDAHTVIKLTALSSEQEPHSTLAAFLMTPQGGCAWIHAGDSRIYHFNDGALVKRTRDHSYVQALVDRGQISEAEANIHPQGNILLGCLGMTTTPPPVDPHRIAKLQPGDLLMACSDGLWHYFSPEELASVLYAQPPRDAVEILVGEARRRARGTGDNISIAVLKLDRLPAAA